MRIQPIRLRYIHGDWRRLTNYSRAWSRAHNFSGVRKLCVRSPIGTGSRPLTNYCRVHHIFYGVPKLCPRPRAIADWRRVTNYNRRTTVIWCHTHRKWRTLTTMFMQRTADNTAKNRNANYSGFSRFPHRPVVNKFYSLARYFYLPRDVGTCLSLIPGGQRWWQQSTVYTPQITRVELGRTETADSFLKWITHTAWVFNNNYTSSF